MRLTMAGGNSQLQPIQRTYAATAFAVAARSQVGSEGRQIAKAARARAITDPVHNFTLHRLSRL
jgi:hypothetical protein